MKSAVLIITLILFYFIAGCGRGKNAQPEHGHDDHGITIAITEWQDSLEFFSEWEPFVQGKENRAIIHLTNLRDYRAIENGELHVSWLLNGEVLQTTTFETIARPGIFKIVLTPPRAGDYRLQFRLESPQAKGTIVVKHVQVYEALDVDKLPHEPENPSEIFFLKEQQWQVDFRTELAQRRQLHENIRALGEIKSAQFAEADIFAPFDGVLMPDAEHGVVRPGQQVSEGEVIAQLVPHGGMESGWGKLVNEYNLAKADFERVERLALQNAISEKRVMETRANYEELRAQVRGALGVTDAELDKMTPDGDHFHLRVPKSGVLSNFHLHFGQHVEVGEHLVSVINPEKIWIEAQVPPSESTRLKNVNDAFFTVTGSDQIYRIRDFNGRLVSSGALLDPETRRIPVIFELTNSDNTFRPGSFAQVFLRMPAGHEAIAVRESAILDEDGLPILFVQTGGESFEKRLVRTGTRDEGYVEILSGIQEFERVVTEGAYKVRLAAIKVNPEESGHGHAH